jgi:mRNA interferase HigB
MPEDGNQSWTTESPKVPPMGKNSILKAGRVVFNICGNKYRLIVRINYQYAVIYIRFAGTHKEYDKIDAETI